MNAKNALTKLVVVTTVLVFGTIGVSAYATGCGGADVAQQDQAVSQESGAAGTETAFSSLSDSEQLIFLREEEKLARDVYLALYDKWGIEEFRTIADSETRHMASVKNLLDRYGLEDPVGDDEPGVFVNEELQLAYDELVELGSSSLADAYQVGITIEKMDIEDLETLLASTDSNDIVRVAENLLQGSQNHLAAFSRLAEQ